MTTTLPLVARAEAQGLGRASGTPSCGTCTRQDCWPKVCGLLHLLQLVLRNPPKTERWLVKEVIGRWRRARCRPGGSQARGRAPAPLLVNGRGLAHPLPYPCPWHLSDAPLLLAMVHNAAVRTAASTQAGRKSRETLRQILVLQSISSQYPTKSVSVSVECHRTPQMCVSTPHSVRVPYKV